LIGVKMGTAERTERARRRRCNEILDAAGEVFFEKGLKEATMDDVTQRVELSKGTPTSSQKSICSSVCELFSRIRLRI
jgi:hypothetical protein